MIVEAILHRSGWQHIWYAHPGNFGFRALVRGRFGLLWPGRWMVGVWTGPQNDLLCVRHCRSNHEAEKYLSPPRTDGVP